jgi:hypothetical protein
MAYSFHITFYANGLQADNLSAGLEQLAAIAPRYNASHWVVYRSSDDRYRQILIVDFDDKRDFQKYWYGPEAGEFRVAMSGVYQNPVVYIAHEITTEGSAVTRPAAPAAA